MFFRCLVSSGEMCPCPRRTGQGTGRGRRLVGHVSSLLQIALLSAANYPLGIVQPTGKFILSIHIVQPYYAH